MLGEVISSIGSSVSSRKGTGIAVAGIGEVGPCSTREGVMGLGGALLFFEEDEVEEDAEEEVDDSFDIAVGRWYGWNPRRILASLCRYCSTMGRTRVRNFCCPKR